jgi:4-hydroxy-2-oxoheptanedioate aldolase
MGANLLVHSADISLFQKHLRLELDAIRAFAGGSAPTSAVRVPIV